MYSLFLNTKPLLHIWFADISFPLYKWFVLLLLLFFILLIVYFVVQVFSLMEFWFLFFCSCVGCPILRILSQTHVKELSPTRLPFLSRSLQVSGVAFKPLIQST